MKGAFLRVAAPETVLYFADCILIIVELSPCAGNIFNLPRSRCSQERSKRTEGLQNTLPIDRLVSHCFSVKLGGNYILQDKPLPTNNVSVSEIPGV